MSVIPNAMNPRSQKKARYQRSFGGLSHDAWGWLIWKEFRLVAPLFVAIAIVLLLVFALPLLAGNGAHSFFQVSYLYTPLLFPLVIAASMGMVLVGQEREQRNLDWLRTLPLTANQLIAIKGSVAVVCLLACWGLASICIDPLVSWTRIEPKPSLLGYLISLSVPFWMLQSVFVLLVSFFSACRFQGSIAGVIAIITGSLVPRLMVTVLGWIVTIDSPTFAHFLLTLAATPAMIWFAYQSAVSLLSPAKVSFTQTSTDTALSTPHSADHTDIAGHQDPAAWLYGFVVLPTMQSGLNWEAFVSLRLSLSVVVGLVLTSLIPIGVAFKNAQADDWGNSLGQINPVTVLIMLLPLGVSWAGVGVFQGDGLSARLRFLADRGVNPWRVFYSRHLPATTVLLTLWISYVLFAPLMVSVAEHKFLLPSPLVVLVGGACVYGVSQWISQLVRMPTLAYLFAPIAGLLSVVWLSTCHQELLAPFWLVTVCGAGLLLLVSGLMMRRFMEGRDRPTSFLLAGVVAIGIGLVPLWPAIGLVRSYSAMKKSVREPLLAEVEKLVSRRANAVIIARRDRSMPASYESQFSYHNEGKGVYPFESINDPSAEEKIASDLRQWVADDPASPDRVIRGLYELRQAPQRAAMLDKKHPFPARLLWLEFQWAWIRFLVADADAELDQKEMLHQWIDAATLISSALYRSGGWEEVALAEVLEISLADRLTDSEFRAGLDTNRLNQSLIRLASIPQRAQARREAVLSVWRRARLQKTSLFDDLANTQSPVLYYWLHPRRVDMITMTLLEACGNSDSQSRPNGDSSWRKQLHESFVAPRITFEAGPYGSRITSQPAAATLQLDDEFPAALWGMPWENEISIIRSTAVAGNDLLEKHHVR